MYVATMLADHKQIDERTAMRNQNRGAACGRQAIKFLGGRGGGGLQLARGRLTLALSSFSDIKLFALRGRFLAHKCIILETKSKLNLR